MFMYDVLCKDAEHEGELIVLRGAVSATDYEDAAAKVRKYFAETLVSMGLKQCDSPFIDFDEDFFDRYFAESDIELPDYEIIAKQS